MATSISLGFPLYLDGMTWNGALSRQVDASIAFTDGGSASAAAPLGGVVPHATANLAVTAPVSGMTVNVAAGYVVVPSHTSGQGAYYFGLMSSGSLTVASNATGSTRQDYVIAYVSDTANSSSFAEIEYLTGTGSPPSLPASSIVLAQLAVPNAASNITSGMITDKRSWVVARGGVLPVNAAANAPAGHSDQFLWNIALSQLQQCTPTAGTPKGTALLPSGTHYDYVPAGTTVTGPGVSDEFFGGSALTTLASVQVTADGNTDYEIACFISQLTCAESDESAQSNIYIDGTLIDYIQTYSGNSFSSSRFPSAEWTYITSSRAGTRMSAGVHTVSLEYSDTDGDGDVNAVSPFYIRCTPVALQ
jgi:hypothetical protein